MILWIGTHPPSRQPAHRERLWSALCEYPPQYSALGTGSWRRMGGGLHQLTHNQLLRARERIVFCLVEKLEIYFIPAWNSSHL